jgi:hypothetical protein
MRRGSFFVSDATSAVESTFFDGIYWKCENKSGTTPKRWTRAAHRQVLVLCELPQCARM